ncbi:hypothetical protein Bbelb_390780 [Branchiostoma belcheri]|nr:hypothetical protein Bbelb_390780 [Branchiostoma belcheri]
MFPAPWPLSPEVQVQPPLGKVAKIAGLEYGSPCPSLDFESAARDSDTAANPGTPPELSQSNYRRAGCAKQWHPITARQFTRFACSTKLGVRESEGMSRQISRFHHANNAEHSRWKAVDSTAPQYRVFAHYRPLVHPIIPN